MPFLIILSLTFKARPLRSKFLKLSAPTRPTATSSHLFLFGIVYQTLQRLLSWTPCNASIDDVVLCVAAAEAAEPASTGSPYTPNYFSRATYLSSPMQCLLIQVQPKPPPTFERCDLASVSDAALLQQFCGNGGKAATVGSSCANCPFYFSDTTSATLGGVYVATAGRTVCHSIVI